MNAINPLQTSLEEQFVVGESDFAFLDNLPYRCEGAAFMVCHEGSADITVNELHGRVVPGTVLLLLPNMLLLLTNRSDNFHLSFCVFSRDMFTEAAFPLEPSYFRALSEQPFSRPPRTVLESIHSWFEMQVYSYRDRENIFRDMIVRNRLQNMLLEVCDKMLRYAHMERLGEGVPQRQIDLFQRFASLVHENCKREREVHFYADRLCISTRYLSTIVRNVAQASPKELIDRAVMLEIRMLLQSTDLSVQEVAYRLHFPDQSYLGRFFKKYAGMSPTEFRHTKK